MDHAQVLDDWLKNLSAKAEMNSEVVTPETLKQKYLLHISKETKIKDFIPRIGTRQGHTEDRTVPRITTAPTVLGCMIGYAAIEHDFAELASTGAPEDYNYKGGWKIYAFEFNAAIRPNGRLVYDQTHSDEHWLVSFSPENSIYRPISAGKCFYTNMTLHARTGKTPMMTGDLFVEVVLEEGIYFSKNIFLEKGYHAIQGPAPKNTFRWDTDKEYLSRKISKEEFTSAKMRTAALLSYHEKLPDYMKW